MFYWLLSVLPKCYKWRHYQVKWKVSYRFSFVWLHSSWFYTQRLFLNKSDRPIIEYFLFNKRFERIWLNRELLRLQPQSARALLEVLTEARCKSSAVHKHADNFSYNNQFWIFNWKYHIESQVQVNADDTLLRYLDVYTTQSPESKLVTATAWYLLAFIILSTSFHWPVRGSNSRMSSTSEELPWPPN